MANPNRKQEKEITTAHPPDREERIVSSSTGTNVVEPPVGSFAVAHDPQPLHPGLPRPRMERTTLQIRYEAAKVVSRSAAISWRSTVCPPRSDCPV
jgi:hypothetical protein